MIKHFIVKNVFIEINMYALFKKKNGYLLMR